MGKILDTLKAEVMYEFHQNHLPRHVGDGKDVTNYQMTILKNIIEAISKVEDYRALCHVILDYWTDLSETYDLWHQAENALEKIISTK